VSIVDNILRAVPNIITQINLLSAVPKRDLEKDLKSYDNQQILRQAVEEMRDNLNKQFQYVFGRDSI
jgi:4-phosphopantoate--beta-alanine ligase